MNTAPGHGLGRWSAKRGPKPRRIKRDLPLIICQVMAVLEKRGMPRHDPVHLEQFIAYCVSNERREEIPQSTIEDWAIGFERDLTASRKPTKHKD